MLNFNIEYRAATEGSQYVQWQPHEFLAQIVNSTSNFRRKFVFFNVEDLNFLLAKLDNLHTRHEDKGRIAFAVSHCEAID